MNDFKNQQSFIQNVACAMLICKNDKDSTVVEANEAFYQLVGYTRQEMKILFEDRFADLVLDNVQKILLKVNTAVQKEKVLDYEYRIRHKNGNIIWIHDIATYDRNTNCFNVVIKIGRAHV